MFQLPPDGTIVFFEISDGKKVLPGTLSIASVGEKSVDGKKCRWIEIRLFGTENDRKIDFLAKLLIPEKYLTAGQNPLKHAIKGRIKSLGFGPEEFQDYKNSLLLAYYLTGTLEDQHNLKPAVISTKLGKLECPGIVGTNVYTDHGVYVLVESWLSKKVPFGLVSSHMQFVVGDGGRFTSSCIVRILKTGRKAISEMPDFQ